MNVRARRLFYIAPLLFWMLVIFVASTRVGTAQHSGSLVADVLRFLAPDEPEGTPEALDKANLLIRKEGHITEYAILTLFALRVFQFGSDRLTFRAWVSSGLLAVLYAATDEFHQRFVPGRTPAVHDVFIDSLGAAVVLLATPVWFALKHREHNLYAPPTYTTLEARSSTVELTRAKGDRQP